MRPRCARDAPEMHSEHYSVARPGRAASPSCLVTFSPPRNPQVNFEELGRCTDDFNGAQLKAVCVEALPPLPCVPHLIAPRRRIRFARVFALDRRYATTGGYDRAAQRADRDRPRGLHGGRHHRAGEEEGLARVLRVSAGASCLPYCTCVCASIATAPRIRRWVGRACRGKRAPLAPRAPRLRATERPPDEGE